MGAGVGLGAGAEQRIPVDDLGADEVLFQVGVDGAGGLDGARVRGHGPGAALVLAHGEERDQAHELVGLADEAHQAALLEAVAGKELGGLLVGHLGQLGLDLAADDGGGRAGTRGQLRQPVLLHRLLQVAAQVGALADVERVEHGLLAEEHEAAHALAVLGGELQLAQRALLLQLRLGAQDEVVLALQLGVAHLLEVFFQALRALFDLAQIADHEVELDVAGVAQGVDLAHVRDGGIFEGAQHVGQAVHLAQAGGVGGLLERFLADGGHVGELDRGVDELLGAVEGGEAVETVVGDLADADVGLAAAAVLGHVRLGQDLEERGLADLGETYDSCLHKGSS